MRRRITTALLMVAVLVLAGFLVSACGDSQEGTSGTTTEVDGAVTSITATSLGDSTDTSETDELGEEVDDLLEELEEANAEADTLEDLSELD